MKLKWEDCYRGQLSVGEEGLPFCQDARWSVGSLVLLHSWQKDSSCQFGQFPRK